MTHLAAAAIFAQRRAAELAGPDHQRFVEQPALLQILDQRGDRLVGHLGVEGQLDVEIRVMVPRGVNDVHEPHAALDHPPRQQAVGGERAELPRPAAAVGLDVGLLAIDAVHVERRLRLAATGRSAPARPTACGRPARSWRCGWRSPDRAPGRSGLVHARQRVEPLALQLGRQPGGVCRFSTGSPLLRNSTPA